MGVREYIVALAQSVPLFIYCLLLLLLLITSLVVSITIGMNRGWRIIIKCALLEYIFLTYSSTLFFRDASDVRRHNFKLFWSYDTVKDFDLAVLEEPFMNVIVFIPLGILLGLAFRNIRIWHILLTALLISISIETLQYFFKLGFSELDDVFHNVLGAYIGIGLYKLGELSVKWLIHRIK